MYSKRYNTVIKHLFFANIPNYPNGMTKSIIIFHCAFNLGQSGFQLFNVHFWKILNLTRENAQECDAHCHLAIKFFAFLSKSYEKMEHFQHFSVYMHMWWRGSIQMYCLGCIVFFLSIIFHGFAEIWVKYSDEFYSFFLSYFLRTNKVNKHRQNTFERECINVVIYRKLIPAVNIVEMWI